MGKNKVDFYLLTRVPFCEFIIPMGAACGRNAALMLSLNSIELHTSCQYRPVTSDTIMSCIAITPYARPC